MTACETGLRRDVARRRQIIEKILQFDETQNVRELKHLVAMVERFGKMNDTLLPVIKSKRLRHVFGGAAAHRDPMRVRQASLQHRIEVVGVARFLRT